MSGCIVRPWAFYSICLILGLSGAGCSGSKPPVSSTKAKHDPKFVTPTIGETGEDINAIPAGDYLISEIRSSLSVPQFKALYEFKQTVQTAGKLSSSDPIESTKSLGSLKLKIGETFWPSFKFNLPYKLSSAGSRTEFEDIHEYGNQWFSEKPKGQEYYWWSNEGEGGDYIYLYKIFTDGKQNVKGIYVSNLNGTVLYGYAAIRSSKDELKISYEFGLGGVGGDAVVEIIYKKSGS